MIKIKYSFLAFVMIALFVSSCTKENIDEPRVEKEEIVPIVSTESNALFSRSNEDESTEGLDLGCIVVNFPFEVVDEDGQDYAVTSDEDFMTLFDSISGVVIVDFKYPLGVTLEDGTATSAEDAETLGELFAECIPDGGWNDEYFPAYLIGADNSCFSISYPITLSDPSGNTVSIENEEDYIAAIAEQELSFVFPFNLTNLEGENFLVESVDGLFEFLISCNDYEFGNDSIGFDWENNFEYLGCYQIAFPIVIELQDGTTVTVENHEEYCDILLQGQMKDYGYPLVLTDSEGQEIVVNTGEELENALDECGGVINFGEDFYLLVNGAISIDSLGLEPCYDINFPITAEYFGWEDSLLTEITFDNMETVLAFDYPIVSLEYPVTITLGSSGTEVVLESLEDLYAVLEECY